MAISDTSMEARGSSDIDLKPYPSGAVYLAIVALVWLWPITLLWPEWEVNAQYEFGKFMPLLTAYLAFTRWRTLPAKSHIPGCYWILWGMIVCALLAALVMFVQPANPEWRMMAFAAMASVSGFTILLIAQMGGLGWVRHLLFPLLFFWLAVPWPRSWEMQLMAYLMANNAAIAAEVLRWWGMGAAPQGNLIQLATGIVGIDEACSGIRSLNGSIMMAVFLGEWFSVRLLYRFVLVGLAVVLALTTNLARTLWLTSIANNDGIEAVKKWHDPAGISVLIICSSFIVLAAWCLRRPALTYSNAPRWKDSSLPSFIPSMTFLLIALLTCAGVKFYRYRTGLELRTNHGWTLQLPTGMENFQKLPINSTTRSLLRYDEGDSAQWEDSQGRHWHVFQFRWYAGRSSYQDLVVHDPQVCLQAMGLRLEKSLGLSGGLVTGDQLPVRAYVFRQGTQVIHVFDCLTDDKMLSLPNDQPTDVLTWRHRWKLAVRGSRSGAKQRLQVALWNAKDNADAVSAFNEFLRGGWRSLQPEATNLPNHATP